MKEKRIFSFWMQADVRARLEILARERDVSLGKLICLAIDQFLLRETKGHDGKIRSH